MASGGRARQVKAQQDAAPVAAALIKPERSAGHDTYLTASLALVCVALSVMLRPYEIRDADVFWHLATGRWMLQMGQIPTTDPFSHTVRTIWIDHEWLYQLLLRWVQLAGGLGLLFYVKGILYTAAFAGAACLALRKSAVVIAAIAAAAICTFAAFPFSEYRPVMVSMCLLVATMHGGHDVATSRERQSPDWRKGNRYALFWLPALFILWANLHATFMIGLAALAIYLGFAIAARQMTFWRGFILMIVCVLATLLNPYGPLLWAVPGRVAGSQLFMQSNQEWRPPDASIEFVGFYVLAAALVVVVLSARGRLFGPEMLLTVLLAIASIRSRRIIPYFAVAAVPLLAAGLSLLMEKRAPMRRVIGAIAAALIIAGAVYAWQFRVIASPIIAPDDGLAFISGAFPEHCAKTLRDTRRSGHLFNDYNHGGYLHYTVGPGWKVYMDGRNDLFGEALTLRYQQVALAQGNWRQLLDDSEVDAAIVSYDIASNRPNVALALAADAKNWAVTDFDDAGMLLVRRSAFDVQWLAAHEYRVYKPMLLYEEQRERLLARGEMPRLIAEMKRRTSEGYSRIAEDVLAQAIADASPAHNTPR